MPRGKALKSVLLIDAARSILEEVQPATVRGVCYRLFTAGLLDSMAKNNTARVSHQLVYAREQGLIDWRWIVDESRRLERTPSWDDPDEFVEAVTSQYRRDRWGQQPRRVVVLSEKETVKGILGPVLRDYGLGFLPLHGFSSCTKVKDLAFDSQDAATPLLALYVGDWDPSGMHMSEEDLPERLERYGGRVELRRIALTAGDTRYGDLPSFSVEDKRKDPRYPWFVKRYGDTCWELDAMSPVDLRARVEREIASVIDWDAWERCQRVESVEKASLVEVMSTWNAIAR